LGVGVGVGFVGVCGGRCLVGLLLRSALPGSYYQHASAAVLLLHNTLSCAAAAARKHLLVEDFIRLIDLPRRGSAAELIQRLPEDGVVEGGTALRGCCGWGGGGDGLGGAPAVGARSCSCSASPPTPRLRTRILPAPPAATVIMFGLSSLTTQHLPLTENNFFNIVYAESTSRTKNYSFSQRI